MKNYQIVIFLILILSIISCNVEGSTERTETIFEVSIYPEKAKNFQVANDFVNIDWPTILSEKIDLQDRAGIEGMQIFAESKKGGNEGVIKFTYPGMASTEFSNKIKKIFVDKMTSLNAEYEANKKFIDKATKLSKNHTAMAEKQDYASIGLDLVVGNEKLSKTIDNPAKQIEEINTSYKLTNIKRELQKRSLTNLKSENNLPALLVIYTITLPDNTSVNEIVTYVELQDKIYLINYVVE